MTIALRTNVTVEPSRTLEIRLLGPLDARRSDGRAVRHQEWRTGKNADLLRLLALRAGSPVPVDTLLDALWPAVDRRRAQGSLRTAASHLRSVLGPATVVRQQDGLALSDADVDVARFRRLATDVTTLLQSGQAEAARSTAARADALYRGEFTAHDQQAEWATAERSALAATHRLLLGDAAAAALQCAAPREALGFSLRLTAADPFCERGTRLLMTARVALGEARAAVLEYQRCRALLTRELGIDPSPQTSDLYLAVLRGENPDAQGL